ncbi:MAG TPA: hypothetical protein VMZ92_01190 [Planctomycetota bacterium]|nr:hypothetical protein [Planctomycetota bacterium]
MKRTSVVTLIVCALLAGVARAETKSWGWRGDGTGLFPDATPPVKWGRVSKTLAELTTQAEKPKGDEPGKNAASLGNIPEWAVLGPFPYDPEMTKKDLLEKEFIPDETALRGDVGAKVGGSEWKKIPSTGAQLNLGLHYKDMSSKVFYVHAYLHSKEGGRLRLRLLGPTCRYWMNGEPILSLDEKSLRFMDVEVELKKGWNSLLVKVFSSQRTDGWAMNYNMPRDSAFFQAVLWGRSDNEKYESHGILWEAAIPRASRFSCAQPLVIGDRVIVNADPSFLICFDKKTGKRLWTDYCGHYEFVTKEERAANAELFKQIDPKAARIKELGASWGGTLKESVEMTQLVADTAKLMREVDKKRYDHVDVRQEAGWAGMTSVTDGKLVYTWFCDGVMVCHDLDGKRKWMVLENEGPSGARGSDHHGYYLSPILTDKEFVVSMVTTMGLDRETGKMLWKLPPKVKTWPFLDPAVPITGEGTPCINYEHLGLYKPGVGLFPWSTATVIGNKAYLFTLFAGFGVATTVYTVPETITPETKIQGRPVGYQKEWGLLNLGSWCADVVTANVLVCDGLIYTVAMGGPLRVYDEKTLEPVYSVRLDMNTIMFAYPYPHGSGVCGSPALGGKNIYIFGNGGHTMVIKPGRKFEVVAENRIERLMPGHYQGGFALPSDQGFYPECTASSPIFDGNRIYYQAEGYLYCIGGK